MQMYEIYSRILQLIFIKPWPVRFHQDWTRHKSMKTWRTGCLCLKVLTGLQGHAELMRSGWLMLGLNFWLFCSLFIPPIPLLSFLPCSFVNHSFLRPVIFFTFVLLSTYFLHVWLFLSVPLILCSSLFPFYASSFVFLQCVHLPFVHYLPLAVDEFALSSSSATQTFPSRLIPGAESL